MTSFPSLKHALKYGLLLLGAIVCQLFASEAIMASAHLRRLRPEFMLALLVLGTTSCAVVLFIGVLGALWLEGGAKSAYALSFVLAIFWFVITIFGRLSKFDLVLILSLCEIPVVTFIGGFIYATVHDLLPERS